MNIHNPELIEITKLKAHPRNYRKHPEDQLAHIIASIKEHGVYRNIIVAKDLTILAGHGVTEGCLKLGIEKVPCIVLDILPDEPPALRILAGDNEISHLGEIDDRVLSEILRDIRTADINGLLGTGFDDKMLASMVMVTRHTSEIKDINAAADWAGLPKYDEEVKVFKCMVSFDTLEERNKFIEKLEIKYPRGKESAVCSFWWPDRDRDDPSSVKIEG